MKHTSIKLNTPCEFIDIVPLNPLISKCQIKVCQVGEDPNRNGSIITKETALKLANSLPGSPIVGRFLKEKEDFEEHSREMVIEDGELIFKDLTQPYGFVDLNAKVWFQKFLDDGVEHEYLVTEGYIWTGRYPETQRIIDRGNNQSMELDQKSLQGTWSKDENGFYEFFIINEAVISALCILGEDVEPCFEGASITKVQFSLEDNFKKELFAMMNEIKEILSKGGEPVNEEVKDMETTQEEVVDTSIEETVVDNSTESEVTENFTQSEETSEETNEEVTEETIEETEAEEVTEAEEETAQYNLEEIPEYVELSDKYSQLESEYEALKAEVSDLKEFKLGIDRAAKQDLIAKFYMLADEDKQEVVDNIDTYSLEEIESKLCVACFRKGINFVEKDSDEPEASTAFNLNDDYEDATPAWIKAVEQRSKK